jgi:hypothetical protein
VIRSYTPRKLRHEHGKFRTRCRYLDSLPFGPTPMKSALAAYKASRGAGFQPATTAFESAFALEPAVIFSLSRQSKPDSIFNVPAHTLVALMLLSEDWLRIPQSQKRQSANSRLCTTPIRRLAFPGRRPRNKAIFYVWNIAVFHRVAHQTDITIEQMSKIEDVVSFALERSLVTWNERTRPISRRSC